MSILQDEFNKLQSFDKLILFLKKINYDHSVFTPEEKKIMKESFKKRLSENKNVSADNPCVINLERNEKGYLSNFYVDRIIKLYKEKHNKYKKRDEDMNAYFEKWR